jgi:beta-lactamase regulating signal transducer with metallopeptidase domain/protocatechuate 3,4-dioxygenase beta subunit
MTPEPEGLASLVVTQIGQVTLVAAAALAAASLLCRNRPRLAYLLGLVVLAKCWAPPTWSSPIGVFCWPEQEQGRPANAARPVERVAADETRRKIEPADQAPSLAEGPVDTAAAAIRFGYSPREARHVDLPALLGGVWLAGALGLASFALIQNRRWRKKLRPFTPPDDGALDRLTSELANRLGLRRQPQIMVSAAAGGPAVFGLWRPTIVLPASLVSNTIAGRLEMVIGHEMVHIRRGDLIVGALQWVTQIVWWFHPLVWLTCRQLTRERERCCDEDVLAVLRCPPASYAQCLLDVLRLGRGLPLLPAFPGMRAVDVTRRRFEHILRCPADNERRTPSRHRLLVVALLVAVLPGAPLTRATPADREAADHSSAKAAVSEHPEPTVPVESDRLESAPNKESSEDEPQEEGRSRDPEKRKVAPGAAGSGADADKKPEGGDDPAQPPKPHPISLTGMAIDPDGKPIAGAKIYVASVWADWKRLAETVTDDEGRYEFHDVLLPIERATTNTGRSVGAFEVFGQAKGFGFAWQPKKWYYPDRLDADALRNRITGAPDRFGPDDEIALDLTFSTSASLSGRIVDEKGRAIPGAKLAIRYCEPLGVPAGTMTFGFSALNQQQDVPLEMKLRTTDAEGRFIFTDLPKDCLFRMDVRPPDFPSRWVYAATTDEPQPDYQQSPVLTGDLNLAFVTPIEVPLQVVYGDTGKPAAKVLVSGGNGEAGSSMTSDADGRGTLRLPPGEYRLELLPARGTPYLVTNEELVVGDRQVAEPRIARLRAAGVLEITVEDEETGEGLPNVDLWSETAAPVPANQRRSRELLYFRSFEAETRICRFERPRTDAKGKMRALVEPGNHVVGVGLEAYPSDYAFPSGAATVQCEGGETVEITFEVRKR